MSVCGFSIIRNAIKYDYPIVESIQSILPLVDEFVLFVGQSDDQTLSLFANLSDKLTIVKSTWDDNLREGGAVLAKETNKAFQFIDKKYDWCFYIQGDEIVHENDFETIKRALTMHQNENMVQGLLFKYLHFYGSYDYVGDSSKWYRREIRVIKNDKRIFSFRDAQGFRIKPNDKLKVKLIDAHIYHYGWVKHPVQMQAKQEDFNKLWHSDEWVDKNIIKSDGFDYSQIDTLRKYVGTHPKAMLKRIKSQNWKFDFDLEKSSISLKDKIRKFSLEVFDWMPGEYRNYRILK